MNLLNHSTIIKNRIYGLVFDELNHLARRRVGEKNRQSWITSNQLFNLVCHCQSPPFSEINIPHILKNSILPYRFNSLAPLDGIPLRTCHIPQTRTCPVSEETLPN